MAIKLTAGSVQETLAYDNVLATSIKISQSWPADALQTPNYSVKIMFQLYAIDSNNKIVQDPQVRTVIVNDVYGRAVIDAGNGDPLLQTVIADITTLVSNFINQDTTLSTQPV